MNSSYFLSTTLRTFSSSLLLAYDVENDNNHDSNFKFLWWIRLNVTPQLKET